MSDTFALFNMVLPLLRPYLPGGRHIFYNVFTFTMSFIVDCHPILYSNSKRNIAKESYESELSNEYRHVPPCCFMSSTICLKGWKNARNVSCPFLAQQPPEKSRLGLHTYPDDWVGMNEMYVSSNDYTWIYGD